MSILSKVVTEGAIAAQANLTKQNQYERDKARRAEDDAHDAHMQSLDLKKQKLALEEKVKHLEKENQLYKNLLTKPMHEIASINGNFEKTYHEQQTILGEWMVSQRAFKELAIQLGIQIGRTKEDIIAEGLANDVKVLNNETQHGNDFNQSEWALFYAPKIKAKLGI